MGDDQPHHSTQERSLEHHRERRPGGLFWGPFWMKKLIQLISYLVLPSDGRTSLVSASCGLQRGTLCPNPSRLGSSPAQFQYSASHKIDPAALQGFDAHLNVSPLRRAIIPCRYHSFVDTTRRINVRHLIQRIAPTLHGL